MNIRELIQRSASWLSDKGSESARLEAELLLAHVLDVERLVLVWAEDAREMLRPDADEEEVGVGESSKDLRLSATTRPNNQNDVDSRFRALDRTAAIPAGPRDGPCRSPACRRQRLD